MAEAHRLRKPRVVKPRIHFDENPDYNKTRFRLTDEQVDYIVEQIAPYIEHEQNLHSALTPELQERLGLRYLATGAIYSTIADSHGICRATLSRCVHRVVDAVNDHLFQRTVTLDAQPHAIANSIAEFEAVANMPCTIGLVDGTHVRIKRPSNDVEYQFVNRPGDHSVNVLVVCDWELRFLYTTAQWPGSVNDSRIWRNSAIGRRFEGGWMPHPNATILGDSGFPNLPYLITPLSTRPLSRNSASRIQEFIAHKKTRHFVECAIGVWKQQFRCLLGVLPCTAEFAARVINCCVVLHNLCGGPADADGEVMEDLPAPAGAVPDEADDAQGGEVNARRAGNQRRNQLIQIF